VTQSFGFRQIRLAPAQGLFRLFISDDFRPETGIRFLQFFRPKILRMIGRVFSIHVARAMKFNR
jgi:hypothetical protein